MKKIKHILITLIIILTVFITLHTITGLNSNYAVSNNSNKILAEEGGGVILPPPKSTPMPLNTHTNNRLI